MVVWSTAHVRPVSLSAITVAVQDLLLISTRIDADMTIVTNASTQRLGAHIGDP